MALLGGLLPTDWGRRLLGWVFIAWISAFAGAPVQIGLAVQSASHPVVHSVGGDGGMVSGEPRSAMMHGHECNSPTCTLWVSPLSNQAIVILWDVKAVLRAPDEDGAGLGALAFERPPRGPALETT